MEGANAGPPAVAPAAPPLKVSATKVADPRYGDPLLLNVRVSGGTGDPIAGTVSMNGIELETKELPAQFQIPTTGLKVGTSYRVDVAAGDGTLGGTAYERFVPQLITGTVRLSSTTVPYSAFLPVELAADAPSAVRPTAGTMIALHTSTQRFVGGGMIDENGRTLVESVDDHLRPGTHFVEIEYAGDGFYAPTAPGTGSFVGDLVVERIPNVVDATFSATVLTQGEPLTMNAAVRASTTFILRESPHGAIKVVAQPTDGGEPVVIEPGRAYPGGNQSVRFDLGQFAATHTGTWEIQVSNTGDAITAESAVSRTMIQIKEPGSTAIPTTTSLQLDRGTATVGGDEVLATASVAVTGAAARPTGQVAFYVDGNEVGRSPVGADASARLPLAPGAVGQRSVTARYLGSATHDGSLSPARMLTVGQASSTISVTPDTVVAGAEASVDVVASGSVVKPSGSVAVTEGSTLLGTVTLVAGHGTIVLPVGTHDLTLDYSGDVNVRASHARLTLTVTPGPSDPGSPTPPVMSPSSVTGSFKSVAKHRVKAKIAVSSASSMAPADGVVEIRSGRRVVARGVLSSASTSITLTTKRLKPGKRRLTVRFLGSPTVAGASRTYRVRVR
ncbi:Ig-like domain-containing protein [Nocardioides daeguensis]|uniref:Bacterial Ig-like domain-containing protein n=1 Tax=Nocardioides daeguensis TaxID=908359 RepID=A0ABP6VCB4_9ACTN|nr:Ig-like domain-containing protein [Nocardioides daeguensis]MBV6729394.1 Ig-like domain-containing protein [Nocardioides daeguensis]MCR1771833.1 Ig-like domain-containing protein [Nocardioides daeguensis]